MLLHSVILITTTFNFVLASDISGSGTKFKKCSILKSDLCFEFKIKEIVVKVGKQGTNDDVFLQICSDYDKKDCCKTPALKSFFSDDWSSKDTETWKPSSLGPCKDQEFKVKNKLNVTLSKDGAGPLEVESIDVFGVNPDKKVKELERFQCGSYLLGGATSGQRKQCATGPYHYQRMEKVVVQVGPDGTDDDVKVKVASDTNDVACDRKLSHLLSDDWKKNKLETWLKSSFGDCKTLQLKVTNAPVFSVSKNGKDNLTVRSVTFYMIRSDNGETTKYECGGFTLTGDCKTASLCRHTFSNCRPSMVGGGRSTTNNRNTKPTRRTG